MVTNDEHFAAIYLAISLSKEIQDTLNYINRKKSEFIEEIRSNISDQENLDIYDDMVNGIDEIEELERDLEVKLILMATSAEQAWGDQLRSQANKRES